MNGVRIDKWLWAARFYKTRTLAASAVEAGHVHLNGQRAKPAKDVKPGDEMEINIGELRWVLTVKSVSEKRGPASVARELYEESENSMAARAAKIEIKRLTTEPSEALHGRPTKRDRRAIERFRKT
ncbi:MAG TPA: RNA-binding S4 domain-containing protein [Rhodocyclaceae bacterium]|nr:RNA-binding S4 domain-containing protein [Rhodocyclaceae bacterium]